MNRQPFITLLLSCLCGIAAHSQNIEFVENKGQWDDRVRFMGQVSNGAFFIQSNGFTVVQHDARDWEQLHAASHNHTLNGKPLQGQSLTVHSHTYTVQFEHANPKASILADKELYTYNNYFIGNDPSRWGAGCKIFQGITIKDVYTNIDVRYYSSNGTLKYDIIVHPGGNPSDIAMKYEGIDDLKVKNKELLIGTSVGTLKELVPLSYQYNKKGRSDIIARYYVKGQIVKFDVKDYDPETVLVIDPTLVFCSLTGSVADNWGFTATYGPDGSMFGGGIVFSTGFPVSPGAFQTVFGGGSTGCWGGNIDIGLIKLSPDGTKKIFATYLGGSGAELPQSLIVDAQGELIVAGRSTSSNFPTTAPVIGPGGAYDIILTKFNSAGTALIGSRKIGGTGDDGANITACGGDNAVSLQRNYGDEARSEVNLDGSGNIYLAACTQSADFPIQGGFQTVKGSLQDGLVLKFNPTLSSLFFSSYLGGTGNDAAYVLSLSPSGQIYVAGGTESNNLPGSTAGTIGASNHGSIDGFVSIISNDGSAILKTTYLGTGAIDQVYGLKFDRIGFPYVVGQTTGTWPLLNAAWSQPNGRQFIAKLKPDLSAFVYSTTFGKGEAAPDISPVAFLVDRCENVYVSGWGGKVTQGLNFPTAGVAGLPVTPDALKSAPDINQTSGLGEDFYFFVLKKDATSQLYGSFFGQNNTNAIGDHVDGGTSRFDQNGVIYQAICANCGNNAPFPTYPNPGVYATTKPASANCNLAMVKIAFNFSGVISLIESSIQGVPKDTTGCVPLTVDFKDSVQNAVSYEWNFGDGSAQVKTSTPTISHTFVKVGTFRVMLVGIDSATCNVRDTSYINIKVGASKALADFAPKKIGTCDAFQYRFDNLSTAPAGFSFNAQSFIWDFGDGTRFSAGIGSVNHTFSSAGTYSVKLILNDSTFCNFPDSIVKQIRVAALVKAGFTTPATGCAPYTARFTNTSLAGTDFKYYFGDGDSSSAVSPSHLYVNPGTYKITLLALDSGTCNKVDSISATLIIYGKPKADFTASPQPPVLNTPISFTNLSSADAIRFKWLFGDGDSLITTSRNAILHEYNKSTTYNACLIASNTAGCPDTTCKLVRMLIEPAVDVPTAFTPAQAGLNSVVYVRGFGIARMRFTVWARWGEKVFETSDRQLGWDGKFKGKLLPMDVYAYTLEVEFTDGTKTSKTGDITLIR